LKTTQLRAHLTSTTASFHRSGECIRYWKIQEVCQRALSFGLHRSDIPGSGSPSIGYPPSATTRSA
jgi:hypothetical protein